MTDKTEIVKRLNDDLPFDIHVKEEKDGSISFYNDKKVFKTTWKYLETTQDLSIEIETSMTNELVKILVKELLAEWKDD